VDRWVVRNTVGTLPAARAVCSPNPLKVCLSNPAYILPEGKGEGEGEGGEGGGECYPESERVREACAGWTSQSIHSARHTVRPQFALRLLEFGFQRPPTFTGYVLLSMV
jgi:hypothetical protein